jgi:hypothetical protein
VADDKMAEKSLWSGQHQGPVQTVAFHNLLETVMQFTDFLLPQITDFATRARLCRTAHPRGQ